MKMLQSNIFDVDKSDENQLVVVFGHIGFNHMGVSYKRFAQSHSEFARIRNPFKEFSDQPVKLDNGSWFWFIGAEENHGLSTDRLKAKLDSILTWIARNTISSFVTNGISDINKNGITSDNKTSDDSHASFIMDYISNKKLHTSCDITLIIMNDVFVRGKA